MDELQIEHNITNVDHCYNYDFTEIILPDVNNILFKDVILRNTTKILKTDKYFNESIDDLNLPESLETIIFGEKYELSLDNIKFSSSLT